MDCSYVMYCLDEKDEKVFWLMLRSRIHKNGCVYDMEAVDELIPVRKKRTGRRTSLFLNFSEITFVQYICQCGKL
jgi:hypothetical protein